VLRANRDALMNVLETFAHDPLVEWIKKDNESHKLLARCERRLRGEVRRRGQPGRGVREGGGGRHALAALCAPHPSGRRRVPGL